MVSLFTSDKLIILKPAFMVTRTMDIPTGNPEEDTQRIQRRNDRHDGRELGSDN